MPKSETFIYFVSYQFKPLFSYAMGFGAQTIQCEVLDESGKMDGVKAALEENHRARHGEEVSVVILNIQRLPI